MITTSDSGGLVITVTLTQHKNIYKRINNKITALGETSVTQKHTNRRTDKGKKPRTQTKEQQ